MNQGHGPLFSVEPFKLFVEPNEHSVVMTATGSIKDAFGILPKPEKASTIEEMYEAVQKAVAKHVMNMGLNIAKNDDVLLCPHLSLAVPELLSYEKTAISLILLEQSRLGHCLLIRPLQNALIVYLRR